MGHLITNKSIWENLLCESQCPAYSTIRITWQFGHVYYLKQKKMGKTIKKNNKKCESSGQLLILGPLSADFQWPLPQHIAQIKCWVYNASGLIDGTETQSWQRWPWEVGDPLAG